MYKERILGDKLRSFATAFPAVIICGARQAGKSTLIQHVFPDHGYVVFDPAIDVGGARRDPDLFLDNHPTPVIFDEIQYAPELVAAIKRRIDKKRTPGNYIMTGSQQWAVMKSIAESLAGRAVFLTLEGFCLAEISRQIPTDCWLKRWLDSPKDFAKKTHKRLKMQRTVYEQLYWGWFPGADQLKPEHLPAFYNSYLQTYIERDVRLFSDVADWQQFGGFVQLAAALTAQEINFSQLGRELGITPQTAGRWLSMLSATFQWLQIPAYSGNTIKRISSRPKGHFADTGLACSLQAITSPKALAGHPLTGALFETAVASEIRKLAATLTVAPKMYHWRSYGGAEVDLLLERDGVYYPIEIKLASRASRQDTSGFEAFRKTYPRLKTAPGLVICPTEKFEKISDNDYAMPWDMA